MAQAMLRRLILLCALLAAPAAADPQRQPTPQPIVLEPAPPAPLRPALWKLADADTTIYLFGTIHVLPKGKPWFEGPLAQAADASGELVTEIGAVDPGEVVAVVTELGFLPPGKSLRAMMPPEDRARFEAALARAALPLDSFDRFEPWFAANSLVLFQLRKAGVEGINGPEAFLTERFKAAARPSIALETVRYQLGLFDSLPLEVQLRYLREVVDETADVVAEVDKLTAEWGKGEAEALALAMNDTSNDPVMFDKLLIDRNRIWSRWLAARLEQPGTVFVAVGAGHLAGKGSVQDQLAALGLSTSRVQ